MRSERHGHDGHIHYVPARHCEMHPAVDAQLRRAFREIECSPMPPRFAALLESLKHKDDLNGQG